MASFYAVNPNGHYYNGLKGFGNRYVMKFSLHQMAIISAHDICQLLTDSDSEESLEPVKELKFFQLNGVQKTIQEISAIQSEENRPVEQV